MGRISRTGFRRGLGGELAARAPRGCGCADAHKKIRGKTPTGKASFGLPTFLSEWGVRRAACKAALNPRRAALLPAQRRAAGRAALNPCKAALLPLSVLALVDISQNLIQNKVAPGIPHFSKF